MYRYNLDFYRAIELSSKYYNDSKCGIDNVDRHLMEVLGTNKLTVFFYDCVDQSIMIKAGSFFQTNIPRFFQAITQFYLLSIWEIIKCIVTMTIRYSDLPKDILFLYIIWLRLGNYAITSFPLTIFCILLSSIISAELLHLITIMRHNSKSFGRRTVILLMIPLLPAYYLYQYLKFKLRVHKRWKSCSTINAQVWAQINKYETKCDQLQRLSARMQCTENVLENLTQLTILMMVISLSRTNTRAVENIEAAFVEENALLGYAIAALSFISIIRGQLTFLKAYKNGCLSLTGTLIVAPYYTLGTCSR